MAAGCAPAGRVIAARLAAPGELLVTFTCPGAPPAGGDDDGLRVEARGMALRLMAAGRSTPASTDSRPLATAVRTSRVRLPDEWDGRPLLGFNDEPVRVLVLPVPSRPPPGFSLDHELAAKDRYLVVWSRSDGAVLELASFPGHLPSGLRALYPAAGQTTVRGRPAQLLRAEGVSGVTWVEGSQALLVLSRAAPGAAPLEPQEVADFANSAD